jgi:regulator of protease activity HflC (stomatin/prohibitin superfamily)
MSTEIRSDAPGNAWLQAGGLAFLAFYAAAILAALAWGVSNVHEVPPENRALVVRLGAFHRVQNAGLVLALPRPFEEVILLPSAETVIEQDLKVDTPETTASLPVAGSQEEDDEAVSPPAPASSDDALASIGNRLTGDSGVVQLDVRAFYTVVDPYEYVLEKAHIAAAVDRLVSRSLVAVCAARDLDAILVARPELLGTGNELAQQREQLRGDVMRDVNGYLSELHRNGVGLGIEIKRVDVIARLNPETVSAFDSVLTASQAVLQEVADARTEAARKLQAANEGGDRAIEVAQARASERLAKAQTETAEILQLADAVRSGLDPGLLPRLYRARIATILARTTYLTTVNPKDDTHLIIPGVDR